ncbi:WhiB family transcriptional regulator [Rhodococcus sp. NPDC059968]|uniref:WhiB family transcriptional regulator n=1 Tax=Rhodococcus sp. NPDC059968 TaxID=3347017 RepID=UPI00366E3866
MARTVASTSGQRRWAVSTRWREFANCTAMGDYYFFAPENEPPAARLPRERMARRICSHCFVLDRCRRYALVTAQPHGIWGGLTPSERVALLDGAGYSRENHRIASADTAPVRQA